MGLRDVGASLPPGFRFYPSDEELVCHYLYKKIAKEPLLKGTLVDIDLHTCEPWQLPEVAKLNSSEWYFFNFRDRKYATGYRTNRATTSGYWKATGKDRMVQNPRTRAIMGMRKTLVFYQNRAPHGIKTGWIMHEFRLENPHTPPKEDWVLCRVFHKGKGEGSNNNPLGPQNEFEPTTTLAASSHADQPLIGKNYQTIPCLSQSQPHQTQNPNFHQETNNISFKCDDHYADAPFFDTSFGESSLGDQYGVPQNLGDMRFDDNYCWFNVYFDDVYLGDVL
ncbi:Protein CUP-SHAPED COTYLEDON 3 like [Actinidia chinensis var. chinensis]|uniref:Protein CUP-SHAPED COTYLEDON 3 like n=1 Tax=Actinidia chinensis var. chinensis TaxID=1590841 RepID=A0A2R6PEH1_ACTCC|nr:Protein CUP-SHAPED COTYLEDON 3 like [Actinidia chinensis var. chinensis]